MIKIDKNIEKFPNFENYKENVKHPKEKCGWDEFSKLEEGLRFRLRQHILFREQNGCCAYCGCEIKNFVINSDIDHFYTRDLYPEKALDYNNLLVSCKSDNKKSCSGHKDSHIGGNTRKREEIYTNIVNPTIDNPDDYFEYHYTGEIFAKSGLGKEKAENTINLFNLSYTNIKRKSLFRQILNYLKANPDTELATILSYIRGSHSYIRLSFEAIKAYQRNHLHT